MRQTRLALCALLLGGCVAPLGEALRRLPAWNQEAGASSAALEHRVTRNLMWSVDPHANTTEDDRVVQAMPGLEGDANVTHHAGLLSIDDTGKNQLFYWHFEAATTPEAKPLVVWLNGGPGCSSMEGLFFGISPFNIESSTKISVNAHSWHHFANLLFIDQPVGTGMSFTPGNKYRSNEDDIAEDFYTLLIRFFERHTEYLTEIGTTGVQQSRELYIVGESHAGRWIPEFAHHILRKNHAVGNLANIHINVAGVGIGNGWVHPLVQYDYSDFAHGMGFLTLGQVRTLKSAYSECIDDLESGSFVSNACFQNMDSILHAIQDNHVSGGKALNYYDIRKYTNNINSYPPLRHAIEDYMNQIEVRKVLHGNLAPEFQFKDCSNPVSNALQHLDGVSTLTLVQDVLQQGVRVLFYNGQWDMMCHHIGTEQLLLSLSWNGSDEYQAASKYTWSVEGRHQPAGFAQQGGNLTYLVIANSGHMVTHDVPEVASDMIRRFVLNEQFDDSPQSINVVPTNSSTMHLAQCQAIASTDRPTTGSVIWKWLLVIAVVGAVGSMLMWCVVLMWRRTQHERKVKRNVVIQESDEEELEELEDDLDDLDEEDPEQEQDGDSTSDDELTEVLTH